MNHPNKIQFTPEQINNRTSDYICINCGNQFKIAKQTNPTIVTFHLDYCGLCYEKTSVCHIQNYNYLQTQEIK